MSIYVDPIQTCLPNAKWRWCQVAHLTADTLDELHWFATVKLGLRREWFQHPGVVRCTLPHYDLTEAKRLQAVRMGAVELTREQAAERMRLYRESACTNTDDAGDPIVKFGDAMGWATASSKTGSLFGDRGGRMI